MRGWTLLLLLPYDPGVKVGKSNKLIVPLLSFAITVGFAGVVFGISARALCELLLFMTGLGVWITDNYWLLSPLANLLKTDLDIGSRLNSGSEFRPF